MTTAEKQEEVRRVAKHLYQTNPDWTAFHREILGLGGIVRRTFVTPQTLKNFEQTDAFGEIQQMLADLRDRGPVASDPDEPTRVITVRLPKSVHETLRVEAFEHHTQQDYLINF